MPHPHIYTIPAHKPFVDVLAAHAMQRYGGEPLTLSQLLILLPSRRACRSLREAFLRITEGAPLLLPRMQPIGDVNEDELLLTSFMDETAAAELANLPPAIPASRRLLLLTRLVWQAQQGASGGAENIEQAMYLAQELMRLLDDVAREQLSLDNLTRIVPEEFAVHWQLTLDFLHILVQHWPKLLEEERVMEPVARRNLLLTMLSSQWKRQPPSFPVIAAGSTGSIPATAELLKTIAYMEQGMVVLPGLDTTLSPETREYITPTHPYYGMLQLLKHIGCDMREVETLDVNTVPGAAPERSQLLNMAMLPAEATHTWQYNMPGMDQGLNGLHILIASSPREEAQIVTLILRSVLEKEGAAAALVTHDRGLARRVVAELKRYGIAIDDSAGMKLTHTPAGTYLRLLADMIFSQGAPVPLLALLKHPLTGGGMNLARFRDAVREIELALLRGIRMETGLETLLKAAQQSKLSGEAYEVIKRVSELCAPLLSALNEKRVPFNELLSMHLTCAERLAASDEYTGAVRLWEHDSGAALALFVAELQESAPLMGNIDPVFYSGLFSILLHGVSWRPTYGQHPRLHILSPIEARLQHYDVVVLGSLNEESWPVTLHADAWMNRTMRADFGLPLPERALGMAAHDFTTLACAPVCYMTRASKVGGAPAEPSPWLLRLRALLEGQGKNTIFDGAVFTHWHLWAKDLNACEHAVTIAPPEPRPPLFARPDAFSVTQIETLMRDPYAIYAAKILHLYPLDPIDADPDMAEFGTIVHKALEKFVRAYPSELPSNALEELLRCGQETFVTLMNRSAIRNFWWPRFERIADWFIAQERERRLHIQAVYAESRGSLQLQAGNAIYTISARLDRIEYYKNGDAAIIDYKTGSLPSIEDIRLGYACQLPLEVLIAAKGNIDTVKNTLHVTELEYWKLSGSKDKSDIFSFTGKKLDVTLLAAEAERGVIQLLEAFSSAAQAYYSCPVEDKKPRYNNYEHLSRAAEWESK